MTAEEIRRAADDIVATVTGRFPEVVGGPVPVPRVTVALVGDDIGQDYAVDSCACLTTDVVRGVATCGSPQHVRRLVPGMWFR